VRRGQRKRPGSPARGQAAGGPGGARGLHVAALPTLVFVAKDGDGNDLRDVDVSMDGQALATSDGTAVAVDPGDHSFTFTKEGLPTSQSEVVVREGDKNRRVQIVLGTPKAAAATSGSPASSAFAQGPGLKPVTGLFGLSPNEERGVGLGVGVAGLIGLGVGSVFGFMAKATYDHAVQQCPAGNTRACTAPGAAGRQTAGDQAEVSTIAFIAGGALVAAGAVLYLATPSGSVTVGPTLADRGVGLGVGGRF
jgi:hypothetical protein